MSKKTSIYKDKPLTDVKWDDSKLIKLSHYESKYHPNPEVDKVISAIVEAAKKEPQGFTKKQKKEFIERIMRRLEE